MVYTDVPQVIVMVIGMVAVLVVGCLAAGGVEYVWTTAGQGGRLEFFKYYDLALL